MTCFLVEIPLSERDGARVVLPMSTLRAAQLRMYRGSKPVRLRFAGLTAVDRRLVCMIEAPSRGDVLEFVALAFLPAERLREITGVDLSCGQDPVGDLGPGVQP